MQCWDPQEITRGREDDYSGLLDRTRRNEARVEMMVGPAAS